VTLLEDKSNNSRVNGQVHMSSHNIVPLAGTAFGILPVKLHSAALNIRKSLHPTKGLSSFSTVVFNGVPVMFKVVKAGKGQLNASSERL